MAKCIRVVFKILEIALCVVIGVMVFMPQELEVTHGAIEESESDTNFTPKIQVTHFFCYLRDEKHPNWKEIKAILQWRDDTTKNVSDETFLAVIGCLAKAKKEQMSTCFCVGTSLWILAATAILACVFLLCVFVELVALCVNEESSREYIGGMIWALIAVVCWGTAAALIYVFVGVNWIFRYVSESEDKQYYEIPMFWWYAMGLCAGYAFLAFVQVIIYMIFAILYKNGPPSREKNSNSGDVILIIRDESLGDRNKSRSRSGGSGRRSRQQTGRSKVSKKPKKVSRPKKQGSDRKDANYEYYMELKRSSPKGSKGGQSGKPISLQPGSGSSSSGDRRRQKSAQPKQGGMMMINNDSQNSGK